MDILAVGSTDFLVPYNPAFMAQIALEAIAAQDATQLVAHRHGLPEALVSAWRQHLKHSAETLFAAPCATTDPRIAALEQMDVAIAVLQGEELRYRYANPTYCALAPSPELIGQRMREVFPVSLTDGVESGILEVLRTGEPWEVREFHALLPGKGPSVWEGRITRLPLVGSETPAVSIWIRDITTASQREDALRREVNLLRAISENSSDIMFAKDREGRMQYANPAALGLIGKPFDEVIGRTDLEFLQDKRAAALVTENDQRIMQSGQADEVEESVPLPDGTHRVWLSEKRPYLDEDGRVIGLLGVSRDITYRKDAENSVIAAHSSLQRVLDSITDGLAIFDRDWRYTFLSETGSRLLGVKSEDLIGKCLWDLFPQADSLMFGQAYRLAMDTGVATHIEEFYPAPLSMWMECHCYPSPDGLSIYFRDVTDRRQAQEAALASERRINALLEATPVGLAYADAAGKVQVMNNEAKRIWGSPPNAVNIDDYAKFRGWWADQSDRHGEAIGPHEWPTARALRGEYVLDTVVEIEPFDAPGTRRLVLHRSVPIHADEGGIVGAVTALTDITESVQMKRAIVESNHRIRQLANTIPQLAWMADQNGEVHWFNDRWFDYTGCEEAEMLGWGWGSVHHPEVLPQVVQEWKASIEHGKAFEMTFPLKGKDGQFRPFYTLAEPVKNLDGDVVQWFGTCTDVSALQRVQEDLTKAQHWLQEGLDTGNMVAWEWDFGSDEVRYSDNVNAVLGYGAGKSAAASLTVHEEDRTAYQDAIDAAVGTRGALDHVSRRVRPDNDRIIWVRSKGNVLLRESGEPHGIRGILIDVTEQILRERALEEANSRKDEFLAMLAHELRNPLAPISTAAQLLLLSGADAQRVRSSSEIIVRQVGHMTRLIDDLLDVSRVTRGLVELEFEPIAIKDIVDNAVEQARPLIESRRHGLTLHVDAARATVRGDRVRLCQVVVNLLNNAAKYTPQGGMIDLRIMVEADEVRIEIEDNGIGINSELLPHVFKLFTQATRTPDRTQGGLGLGLALVDSLVRMHGGHVQAFSEGVGKGSRFLVLLPLLEEPKSDKDDLGRTLDAPSFENEGSLSVLVVDDNADAADMLADILGLQGHSVHVEYTSTAALVAGQGQAFDLHVLDIGLPDIDGYELVRQLRSMPRNIHAVSVALTGYGQAHDKVLSKAAGFDYHLVKPVDIAHLDAIIRSLRTKH